MTAAALLDRLEGVKRTGPAGWLARCPAHDDKHPSLSVRELDDGRVLVHDHAGCSAVEVLEAVGLDFAALYPTRPAEHRIHPERRPFPAIDVLRAVALEAMIVAVAASILGRGDSITDQDRARVSLAAERINSAVREGGYA
jgi:hypothetical protein